MILAKIIIAILSIQGLVFGAFCAFIAGEKNRNPTNWFFLGFLFSFISIAALCAVPSLDSTLKTRFNYKHAFAFGVILSIFLASVFLFPHVNNQSVEASIDATTTITTKQHVNNQPVESSIDTTTIITTKQIGESCIQTSQCFGLSQCIAGKCSAIK